MATYGSALKENPLQTKKDMQEAVSALYTPLLPHFRRGFARLDLGTSCAHYGEDIAGMEAFSRLLWGWVPWVVGDVTGRAASDPRIKDLTSMLVTGLINGTDPNHEAYWGTIQGIDQRMVEMAAIGLGLLLSPDQLWDPLDAQQQQNLFQWLNQINECPLVDSNWQFFRVLVNLGFQQVGMPVDTEAVESSLAKIDSFYLGEGWYCDGPTEQRDYYIPFAFHYYGLIYSVAMRDRDPDRARLFKQRAEAFAQDFIYWFAADGSAFPFGRSMTYRFAQAAFWSALAYAGSDVLEPGVLKGLVLRHLRWWMQRPVFSPDGLLTIGYGYANLNMAEGYNAPGSPYWAMKAFLVLALEDDHPFWRAEEKPLPTLKSIQKQPYPRMVLCRDGEQKHVVALTSGQLSETEHAHNTAKYAKFAYSNRFGFSIPKGAYGLSLGAHDSMLALSEKDGYYRGRRACEEVAWQGNILYSLWKPWRDVEVETWLIPIDGDWHVRLHRLQTGRELDTAEGGFAVPVEEKGFRTHSETVVRTEQDTAVFTPWGSCGIVDAYGRRTPALIRTEPNTNLIHACSSFIPTLTGALEPGTHWLGTAVYAGTHPSRKKWADAPKLQPQEGGVWSVRYRGETWMYVSVAPCAED